MKAFHTIATPHQDILEGRLTMDVFAADLWEVSQQRGPAEYKDAETFFNKTYLTQGLENLLRVVEKRLSGKGGDPVIQLHTPFGGGKTHSLIAIYHKSLEWNAKAVTIVGDSLSAEVTLWGLMEKQLTGKIHRFTGKISPGRDAIRELLAEHQPVLILMDEVLEYATKAAGVLVGESTLASQTIAFIQELTGTVSALEKACLVVTLPSSIIEHYDESAERLFQQLQKVSGRKEKIYTPVEEYEISQIVRRRLFNPPNLAEAKKVINAFMEYAEKEGILPVEVQPSEYRERFLNTYPFLPEVIDILYHRWGSFPNFQRTRGVLRLLALVIYSLRKSNLSYITLADFDLSNQEIKQELIKLIGQQFNSVIASDISDQNAGSKKVDDSLGSAYRGLRLGTRAATTVFMYSHSGGQERGATAGEIKRSATTLNNPASVVSEALEHLKAKLFFLQSPGDRYFFGTQLNLNHILITCMDNVKEEELYALEKNLLKDNLEYAKFRPYIWEDNSANIPDSEDLKLVILRCENIEAVKQIIGTKGQTPRVNRNTLFFLYPHEGEQQAFYNRLKRKIAYEMIQSQKDSGVSLTDEQKKEIKTELGRVNAELNEAIRRVYRLIAFPGKEGLKLIDLGIPTYGKKTLDREVYDTIRTDGEILENIAPIVIREKFLAGKDYVSTEQIYQASLKTPGETRFANRSALQKGISEGVQMRLFGLGDLNNDQPICRYFKEPCSVSFYGNEVLIAESICIEQRQKDEGGKTADQFPGAESDSSKTSVAEVGSIKPKGISAEDRDQLVLNFQVPKGKVAGIMGIMNLLQSKFETIEIQLVAKDGSISDQDYEDKIRETFRQLGIKEK